MPIIHSHTHLEQENIQTALTACEDSSTILCLEDIGFSYPDGREVLKEINILMERGEKAALVGPNGAGKSTLMMQINGLLSGSGIVRVGGVQLSKETLPIIRAQVGYVFQNPDDQLFSPTVYEDVAFGPLHMGMDEEHVHTSVKSALSRVGMQEYGDRISFQLSGGEKKRIAIATVLSMNPELLVLDEPTAGLDPRARRQLINLLEDLPIGMLVATHDLWMVKEVLPRMIVLDEGEIAADAPTEDILKDKAFLAKHGLELP